jgi:hypothetical protein
MTPDQLARIIGLPPHEAFERCTGPAREYFYASALLDDALRCSGGSPARATITTTADGQVMREWLPPKQFAATLSSVTEHISDARWDGGLLASLSVDGRPIGDFVVRLATVGGVHMWALLRIQGMVRFVIASTAVIPTGSKTPRARRIEVLGRCDMEDGSEFQLYGSPGLWRVPKGVIGSMSPPRDAALTPSAVRSAWVDTLGTFVPDESTEHEASRPDEDLPNDFTAVVPDEVVAAVRTRLGVADADDVERAAAVAFGLLMERGDAVAADFARPPNRARLEAAVTEALRLLSLDDPPPSHG